MIDEVNNQPQEVQGEQPTAPQESSSERNFRALRENMERERQLRETAEARARELEAKYAHTSEDDDLQDDTYVEAKHLKKYRKKTNDDLQSTRQKIDQLNTAYAELRLKTEYPDLYKVVTDENMEKLAKAKPTLYRAIQNNADLYDKGSTAYELIKSFVDNKPSYEAESKRLEENATKPRSSATAGGQVSDTPLTRIGDYDRRILSEERKEQLRQQVQQAKMMR